MLVASSAGATSAQAFGVQVNKGPHSAGVVAEARRLGALSVRGNHDDACLAAYVDHKAGRPVKVSSHGMQKTLPVAASPEPQTVCTALLRITFSKVFARALSQQELGSSRLRLHNLATGPDDV